VVAKLSETGEGSKKSEKWKIKVEESVENASKETAEELLFSTAIERTDPSFHPCGYGEAFFFDEKVRKESCRDIDLLLLLPASDGGQHSSTECRSLSWIPSKSEPSFRLYSFPFYRNGESKREEMTCTVQKRGWMYTGMLER
jgi:hypothetical protein